MDSPPIPSHTPPSPPTRSTNDKRGCMIALIAVVVGMGLLIAIGVTASLVIPLLNPSADTAMKEKLAEAPKLTAEMEPELIEFAQGLVDDVENGDLAAANARCDFEALAARVFDGAGATGLVAVQMRQGFLESVGKQGFFSEVSDAGLKPLRVVERGGFPAVTLRILPATGGVNYVDILIWKSDAGFKVIDLYTYLYGSYSSSDSRDMLAAMLADSDQKAFAKILGVSGEKVDELTRVIKTLNEKAQAGDHEGLVEAFRSYPEDVQKLRLPFMRYLTALQELTTASDEHTAAYREAIRKAPAVFGSDATTNLLLVDDYLMEEAYDDAIQATNRVDEAVGGDPYLHVLRGWIYYQQGKMADVMRCIALADQEEPGMTEVVDLKLTYYAKTKDHAALVQELKDFQVQYGTRLGRAELSQEPQYEEFLKSPEFAAYEKQGE